MEVGNQISISRGILNAGAYFFFKLVLILRA